jgi:DNA repair exonuclease SbcCD ATPase subunit
MMAVVRAALVVCSAAMTWSFSAAESSMAQLSADLYGTKNRPVTKVITLLKDMLKQLEKEGEEDKEVYEKMTCWCQTNDKEKTKSIAEAETRIAELTTSIEELTAGSARLGTEIKNLEKEVTANQEALDKATAIREKELAEFNAEEKDLLESISALKAAVTVLSKHNSFLQLSSSNHATRNLKATLKRTMLRHAALVKSAVTPSEHKMVMSFIQEPGDYSFSEQPAGFQSYAPQSGEVFGILKQMKESFEGNLADSQKEESTNQKAYEELKAAKEEEISAGQAQIEAKTEELATTDMKCAQAKEDVKDTKASLAADEEFLAMLKEKCQMTDGEWEERSKTRSDEMAAVSKALEVLSSDDAHDLFTKTFNPALIQASSARSGSDRRNRASNVLTTAAKHVGSHRLAALAVRVRLDAFERVKKAIDDMVTQLLQEKADEIKHKDFCVDEFNKNQLETEKKTRESEDLSAQIEDLTMTIEKLTKAIETLKAEVAELQVQLKRAGEDREIQNKDFQTTVADQRATQKLLKTALAVLGDFYKEKKAAALLQGLQEPAGPPPPAGFEEYKKNAGSGGVMDMLEQIISDAKAMENEAIRSEEDAQKAYEDFVKETNGSIEAKSQDIVNKEENKAKAESELVETKEAKEGTMLELEQLGNYKAELHQSCDFVQKNFEVRQTARDEEVEALKQAKAILSGAKFEEFLQKA